MAAVLDFVSQAANRHAPSLDVAEEAMRTVIEHLGSLPARVAVPRIAAFRTQLDAVEATALADVIDTNGDTKAAENISARGGKTSKRARKRTAKRAAAVKKNAALADKMASGELSGEHVDALASAAAKTNDASLTDSALIDAVADANPDLASSIIDDYLVKNTSADEQQTRHERQRSKRRVSRFRTRDECEAIMIAGDKPTIDSIWAQVSRAANALYNSDGGRDLPLDQHPRSHDQRMFDAITQPLRTMGAGAAKDAGTSPGTKSGAGASRPTIVVGVSLEKFSGLDHTQAAELIGSGPIADSVLAQYLAADPIIVGALFGVSGQPLWLGRNARLASKAQMIALIVRDKHCVLCGADHVRCRAHHTQPWNAPQPGPTDIDNLVLVCDSCHRHIHDEKQTIVRDKHSGRWKLRPALPHEIPPSRPKQHRARTDPSKQPGNASPAGPPRFRPGQNPMRT